MMKLKDLVKKYIKYNEPLYVSKDLDGKIKNVAPASVLDDNEKELKSPKEVFLELLDETDLKPEVKELIILRLEKNLTHNFVAKKIGVGKQTIWNWENAKRVPEEENLKSIRNFLKKYKNKEV